MFNGDEVEETEFPGFISDEQTFYCGNVDKELLLQTTSSRVRLLSTDARKRLRYIRKIHLHRVFIIFLF